MRRFFISLTRNPTSLLGAAITTISGVLFVTLFTIELVGFLGNPYIGIIAYMILPAIFIMGLVLIPIGVARERRRRRASGGPGGPGKPAAPFPVIDLNLDRTRNWLLAFIVLTAVNAVILATATYKGVEMMESNEFCGETCHSVMAPEFTAHQRSPHSNVLCVDCHIGPGADWFVKSKLSGAWQVISVAFDLYPRPISTPVHDLRPARDTCEQCHWPTKFVGKRPKVITRYEEDEENTELKTVLLLEVGGEQVGESTGIHWHVDPGNRIRYKSDELRETIYDVELTRPDGSVQLFRAPDTPEEGREAGEWRIMDCIDCHNRPTHVYQRPGAAVDLAIQSGIISRELPYIRREAAAALQTDYASHGEARAGLSTAIETFYEREYPEIAGEQAESIREAGDELGAIYATNVFPSMKVTWDTYPDHIGHESGPGCYRCHNDEHVADDGEVISQDCDLCHAILAWDEEDPEILEMFKP